MFSIKAEPTMLEINQSNAKCPYCQAKITTEKELQEGVTRNLDSKEPNSKSQVWTEWKGHEIVSWF